MGKEIIRAVSASILKRIIVHTAKKWAIGRENVSREKKDKKDLKMTQRSLNWQSQMTKGFGAPSSSLIFGQPYKWRSNLLTSSWTLELTILC